MIAAPKAADRPHKCFQTIFIQIPFHQILGCLPKLLDSLFDLSGTGLQAKTQNISGWRFHSLIGDYIAYRIRNLFNMNLSIWIRVVGRVKESEICSCLPIRDCDNVRLVSHHYEQSYAIKKVEMLEFGGRVGGPDWVVFLGPSQ